MDLVEAEIKLHHICVFPDGHISVIKAGCVFGLQTENITGFPLTNHPSHHCQEAEQETVNHDYRKNHKEHVLEVF